LKVFLGSGKGLFGWRACFVPNLAFARAKLRRMGDELGVVAEIAKSLGKEAEIAVPKKLARLDVEVCKKKHFHSGNN